MTEQPVRARPLVVEIAGVAGSGKSTLSRIMCVNRGFGVLDDTLRMRDPRHLLVGVHSIPRLGRLLSKSATTRRKPSWTELKLIIYVMEWNRRLINPRGEGATATIMDQGPVYALARLGQIEPPIAGTEVAGDWWNAMVDVWASSLDAVVWLDAPNDVLLQRVSGRSQAHEIKEVSEATAVAFVDRYRASYERVLSAMDRPGGPVILRYDSNGRLPDDIASSAIDRLAQLEPATGNDPASGNTVPEGGP